MEKDLNYWKKNAEEDYMKVPISVLRYITELEKAITNPSDVKTVGEVKTYQLVLTKDRLPLKNGEYITNVTTNGIPTKFYNDADGNIRYWKENVNWFMEQYASQFKGQVVTEDMEETVMCMELSEKSLEKEWETESSSKSEGSEARIKELEKEIAWLRPECEKLTKLLHEDEKLISGSEAAEICLTCDKEMRPVTVYQCTSCWSVRGCVCE